MRRIVRPFQAFIQAEAAGGIVLVLAAVVALLWANSPWGASYAAWWHTPLSFGLGGWRLSKSLEAWISDGLMTLFFFVVGLVVGKQLGIIAFSWLAVKSRLATLPSGVTWRQLYGVGWIAGIGFTVSLFIADLAFTDEQFIDLAKVGILAAAVLSGGIGWVLLWWATHHSSSQSSS